MTPKEKAAEMIESFMNIKQQDLGDHSIIHYRTAKQCALISVNEIIGNLVELSNGEFTFINNVEYYQDVKQEIFNL